MHCRPQCAEDVGVGVVAHGAGEDPADTHIGEVEGAGELTFEGWPAVRDGVAFEKPRRCLNLIGGLTDLDRRPQQRGRLGGRFALDLVAGLGRAQVAVDRRAAHRHQLGTHLGAVAVPAGHQFAVAFQSSQLNGHGSGQVPPALPTRGRPDLLQHLQRIVGILRFALPARPFGDLPARSRRPPGRGRQPAPSIVTRPAGDLHHLIQNLTPVRLRRLHIRPGEPRGDLGTRRHRQPTLHAWRRSPFRGHSYVMHRGRFAGTFRDACRLVG